MTIKQSMKDQAKEDHRTHQKKKKEEDHGPFCKSN